ncbi:MAG TPA: hypothetical protein VGG06_01655 [Thermoanaerobaculia bacterium]
MDAKKHLSPMSHLRGAVALSKWKVRLGRLRKERQRTEQERSRAAAELGARAWELQIRDDRYAPCFDQLTTLEQQRSDVRSAADRLRASVSQQESERKRIDSELTARISEVEAELAKRNEQLAAATGSRKEAEKLLNKLQSQQKATHKALTAARAGLQKAESAPPESPERAKAEPLRGEIARHERDLGALGQQVPPATEEVKRRTGHEAERQLAVDQQKERLARERDTRTRTLQPIDETLKQLRAELTAADKRATSLDEQRAHGIAELGVQVNAARPPAGELAEAYARVDRQDAELALVASEVGALEERIAAAGSGARLTYYSLIAASIVGVVVAGWVALRFFGWDFSFDLGGGSKGEVSLRVADGISEPVLGASAVLFFPGGPVAQYTDIHGAATLTLDEARGRRGRLVVEATGYRIHEQEIRLETGSLVEVRLAPPDPVAASVIVRALDRATGEPVARAEVAVLATGDSFSQVTDSNGITKFTLDFLDSKADVQVSVKSGGFEVKHQNTTLLPDRVQDVSLDRADVQLLIAEFDVEDAILRNFREVAGTELSPGTRATGQLRAGTVAGYTFAGQANTPVLFTVQRTDGELSYYGLIYDPKDFLLEEHGRFYDGTYSIPFTPTADGEYKLHMKGQSQGGKYAVTMSYLSGPPEKRNQVTQLTLDRSEKGMLAVGAFDDFSFNGSANTPLLLQIQRSSGELGYEVELLDDQGTSLARYGRFWDRLESVPFTPPGSGRYLARLRGSRNFGSYTLAMKLVAEDQEVKPLQMGLGEEASLALGAFVEYSLDGHYNTPVLLTLQRKSGELGYSLEIYDSQDRKLTSHGRFWDGTHKVPFTPQADGVYRLRFNAEANYGSFVLSANYYSGPPAARNQIEVLPVGGSHSGALAAGAFDEYTLDGTLGHRVMITTQLSSGNLAYWVQIYDEAGNKVAEHGRFYDGTQRLDFEPPADGPYKIRVWAEREFGSYVITLNEG